MGAGGGEPPVLRRGLPVLGVLPALRRDVLAVLVAARGQGDVVRLPLPGQRPVYHLAHPDHVRHVLQDNQANYRRTPFHERLKAVLGEGLVTSEGALWQRQRRLIQPALQAARVRAFVPVMAEAVGELAEGWRQAASAGSTVDLAREMSDLALAIIVWTMFGRTRRFAEIGPAVRVAQAHVADRFWALAEWPARLPTPANRRFRRALAVLDAAVDRIIRERGGAGGGSEADDLLGRLLAARDDAGGGAMGPREVRDEVMTMFLAGHETSAVGLTWAWYLLARHPEQAERVRAEARAALGDGAAEPADLDRLPLARAVLQEAMRLYPPVPWLGRLAAGADRIGGCAVPAGAILLVSPYVVQRDARWWPEPERFLPERFLAEAARRPAAYTYFPFGGGARTCVGHHFAQTEMLVALAMLAARFRCELEDDRPIAAQAVVTLRPAGAVRMRLAEAWSAPLDPG